MDFYPDVGPAVSAAQLQLQAWHIASSPPSNFRNGYLPRLFSIPEGPAEERKAAAQTLRQDLVQHEPCTTVSSSSTAVIGCTLACDDVLQFLEHPSIAVERQQVAGDSCAQLAACEDAMVVHIRREHPASGHFNTGGRSSSSSSSGSRSEVPAEDDAATAAAAATCGEGAAVTGDLTAAASTWAMEIRHFTDCLPLTSDSVCSSSSYLSLTGAQPHAQKQQQQSQPQQHPQQLHHSGQSRDAAAARTCSLPHSSSSASLPQRCFSDGDAAAEATEAAVRASLAALQELDELEWCPWDRVSQWLESHAAVAAVKAGEQQTQQSGPASDAAIGSCGSLLPASSSSSLTAAAEVSAGEQQQQQQQQCAKDEPVFDAPAWWQEAVLERLEQQRQAFQGSWWSRAKVLASLAVTRAACALHI